MSTEGKGEDWARFRTSNPSKKSKQVLDLSHRLRFGSFAPSESTVNKMVIRCKAAVCWSAKADMVIEEVTVDPPKKNEVRLRMVSSSLCYSDVFGWQGARPEKPTQFPIILGHEGAGVVESVGPGVTSLKPGDHVVPMNWPQCGKCSWCENPDTNLCMNAAEMRLQGRMSDGTCRITCKGKEIHTLWGCATLSEYFVMDEVNVAKITQRGDLRQMALLSCCVPTGLGAVRNVAKVRPGSVCAVWGLGGVGLTTALACNRAGAATVIGIDTNPDKEQLAKKFGCTEFINPAKLDKPVEKYLQERFAVGGCDYVFECVGTTETMTACYNATRPRGGVCTVVGFSFDPEKCISIHPYSIAIGKKILGCYFGGLRFRLDVPPVAEELADGKIDCSALITEYIKLDKVNWAIGQILKGQGVRYILLF